jgi:hypothetical protein
MPKDDILEYVESPNKGKCMYYIIMKKRNNLSEESKVQILLEKLRSPKAVCTVEIYLA